MIEALAHATTSWPRYGTRCDRLVAALARQTGRRLAVRLVKGAYWDSEIKRGPSAAQGYPCFTRNFLSRPRGRCGTPTRSSPQFATHNAHSIAAVLRAPAAPCLRVPATARHGQALYAEAERQITDFPPVRVYAPVRAQGSAGVPASAVCSKTARSFLREPLHGRAGAGPRHQCAIRARFLRAPALADARSALPDPRDSIGLDMGDPDALETVRTGVASRRWRTQAVPLIDGIELPGDSDEPIPAEPPGARRPLRVTRPASKSAPPSMRRGARSARGMPAAAAFDDLQKACSKSRFDFYDLLIREQGRSCPTHAPRCARRRIPLLRGARARGPRQAARSSR